MTLPLMKRILLGRKLKMNLSRRGAMVMVSSVPTSAPTAAPALQAGDLQFSNTAREPRGPRTKGAPNATLAPGGLT